MGERKGWLLVFVGVTLLFLVCLGASVIAFAWTSALVKGVLG